MNNQKLIYDIIGCGKVIQQYHLPIIKNYEIKSKISIRGCFDINLDNASKVARIVNSETYGKTPLDYNLEEVDGAIIATPPDTHALFGLPYLEMGKSIFIEKPFAVNYSQSDNLLNISRKGDGKILVGHFRRYYPSMIIARKFLQVHALGKIIKIDASEGFRWNWQASTDYIIKDKYGNVIYDTGSHLIDMILYITSMDFIRDKCNETNFLINDLEKKPDKYITHSCKSSFEISSSDSDRLRINIFLSRYEQLANMIKIYCEKGILIIPTYFSFEPIIRMENQTFLINETTKKDVANDVMGCFINEHYDFLESIKKDKYSSAIDANHFNYLTSILEELVEA